jgi:hypothetical protein
MAFLIYKKTNAGENVRYERVRPLRLSGPDGLIARHVKSLSAEQSDGWKLDSATLLQLAGCADSHHAVMFDAAGSNDTAVCFYELTCLHGSCRDQDTNLALDFNIVLDREKNGLAPDSGAAFVVSLAATPKKLNEMLALTGGPGGGDWKWGSSALQIGATVVLPKTAAIAKQ